MTAKSKSDEAIGRVLERGRYRLEACIGCGGMGSVYRATDTRLGVERAISSATCRRRSMSDSVVMSIPTAE